MRKEKFSSLNDGKFFTALGKEGEFKNPAGIAINRELERIYVVDSHQHHIVVLSLVDGSKLFTIGQRGTGEGQFNFPSQLAIEPDTGNLWVVDTMNGRIQVLDPEGRYLFDFGQLGDAPGTFSRPKGIGFDSEGHVYVVDAGFNNVQIFNKEGQVLMGFSGYGSVTPGTMILPAGLAIDSNDLIYVADQWNAKISVFQYLSERYKREHPEVMERLTRGLRREGTLKK
jgi:DNA-binding beta-propeller fold protein YncE